MSDSAKNPALWSPKQLAIAEMLKKYSVGKKAALEPIRRDRTAPLALSFGQQRLWFLEQLVPGTPIYNVPSLIWLKGDLNVGVLELSFNELIRRHEVLRTGFVVQDGRPVPVIADHLSIKPSLVDVAESHNEDPGKAALELARQEAQIPFDLTQAPFIRVHLYRVSEKRHLLLVNLHHIVCDGWSRAILIREVASLYNSFSEGTRSSLAPLAIQYSDYAAWQQRWLRGNALAGQLDYWRSKFQPAPLLLQLPVDHQIGARRRYFGKTEAMMIHAPLAQAIRKLSSEHGATLFMTLLASFYLLLYRYTLQTDIVVGTPVANRNRWELEGLIGFFVNTLALRNEISVQQTFLHFLKQIRESTLEAYAHQDLPFEKLVEELRLDRDLEQSPLFQVMFILQNTPASTYRLRQLEIEWVEVETDSAKFDLSLVITESQEKFLCGMNYSSELFEPETIRRMMRHWRNLLAHIVEEPGRRIDDLSILEASELRQVVLEWNRTEQAYPRTERLHSLFEEQAERSPGSVALVCGDQQLTYGELNHRAAALALYLRTLGVGPESLVGICLERNAMMVVGLLAILKAGGAYVPLDPGYPKERLACILNEAPIHWIITRQSLTSMLPAVPATIVDMDAEASWQGPVGNSLPQLDENNLAYVLFTSGSTGKPKGVALTHGNAIAFVHWAQSVFSPQQLASTLFSTSICFDLSIFELFLPLSTGTTVVLSQNALELANLRALCPVTLINTVPSVMTELLRMRCIPSSVEVVNLAGEPLPTNLVQAIYEQTCVQKVYNLYGPTESTTYSTYAHVPDGRKPTIGSPVANTMAYLLDSNMQPVPIGVPGEIYLGGAGVARCYINQPVLTAERFIPDPFSDHGGTRLYRTGDLARRSADGSLHYLGRLDHQVKIRGFRIELGEIEENLARHPQVERAVVLAREDVPGDKRLVAYFVPAGPSPAPEELRQHLQRCLPPYMVPAVFVELSSVPLTPNGKVDRRALPRPEASHLPRGPVYVPPATASEKLLAGIWAEILGLERIGREDNFFDRGGHSLLAVQLRSRIAACCGHELPLRLLFECPTIASLAPHLSSPEDLASQPIPRADRSGPLGLSFAQERLWFLEQLGSGLGHYNIFQGTRLSGALNLPALQRALEIILERHEILRTRYVGRTGQPEQVIDPVQPWQLPCLDLSWLPSWLRQRQVRSLLQRQARQPFDLQQGPVVRLWLLRLEPEQHLLLLTLHHIAADGWSMSVLLQELVTLYAGLSQDRRRDQIALPALPIQYADYAVWQRQWLDQQRLHSELDYWKQQLQGLSPLDLPLDFPRPAVASYGGASQTFLLENSLAEPLRQLARSQGATLFMLLLAALQTLLARYTGQHDIAVGSPVAGRLRQELEPLIGCFINTVVLRTDFSADPSWRQLIGRVRQAVLEAFDHQQLPFEKLVEQLQPQRDLSRTPLFQVMLVLQNEPRRLPRLPGLSLAPLEADSSTSKFEFTLTLTEVAQGLAGRLEYSTDLFRADRMQRLLLHFRHLLQGMLEQPDHSALATDLLTPQERQQLLYEWNRTQHTYGAGPSLTSETGRAHDTSGATCLHELFESQVQKTPDAIAVVFEGQHLTYAELDRRANQLARYLVSSGVGPEVIVGICLERSLEMVIALLAVLKTGGAYAPLDPGYPADWLEFVLNDARAPIVVTQKSLWRNAAPAYAHAIYLDQERKAIDACPAEALKNYVSPQNTAYVIYTSGSAGQPKGVVIAHSSVHNHMHWMQQELPLEENDRLLQKTPFSFDASVWEFYAPLLSGNTLVMAKPGGHRDPDYLVNCIREDKITILQLVPTQLQMLLEHGGLDQCVSLRRVCCGGEVLTRQVAQDFLNRLPWARLYNLYGPTEATIDATFSECVREREAKDVSIGKPIFNTQVYVLDQAMNAVPIGVAGELYIGGFDYWRRNLSGAPPVLELPLDRPRPVLQRFVGAHCPLHFDAALTAALKAVSAQRHVTLYMTLLAGFQLFLSRITGQHDIVVGSPVANRNHREIEGLIGFFANTLVFRTELEDNPTFIQLLDRVRETALAAFARQDVPFERIVEELQPQRDLGYTPLFQVMFVFQNTPFDTVHLPGLRLQPADIKTGTAHFDLTLRLWADSDSLAGRLEYNSDIFEEASIVRMAKRFQKLLESVASDPSQHANSLDILLEDERRLLLQEPRLSATNYPAGLAHELIEIQARKNPNSTAIICGDHRLTYHELNERAAQIAASLQRKGVTPDAPVAVCMERSLDLAATLLAISKSGSHWLPVEPDCPAQRRDYMLRDARASLLVTDESISRLGDTDNPAATHAPQHTPQLEDLAYVIYTSGSTGMPKGVMVSHHNLSNYVHAMHEALGLQQQDVYLHTASFSFSSSVRQLFVPLTRGAAVVIASPEQIADPALLFGLARQMKVTIMDMVPSYWRNCISWLESLDEKSRERALPSSLRLIACASEPLRWELPDTWREMFHERVALMNMLGQTETAGIIAWQTIPAEHGSSGSLVPVGRPIANTAIYLLDKSLNLVPPGVVAEIHIAGRNVARGYLNRPELTAGSFIPDPFSEQEGCRLYRTGDLGRYRPDGSLEFVGRKDSMVKIRGFRVELGEVEAIVNRRPEVKDAAVISGTDVFGYSNLTAYVAWKDNTPGTIEALREALQHQLPDYMVPGQFLIMERLPRTASGKLDRKALPRPNRPGSCPETLPLPRTPLEQELAEIFAQVLNVEKVGTHSSFFNMGGHSLLATQVISRIQNRFRIDLPLRVLFEAPTIAELAEYVEVAQRMEQAENSQEQAS